MNRTNFVDVSYDDSTQDFEVSGGDLVFKTSHTDLMSQLLKDALESSPNSMKYILRNWGFDGRDDDYTATDNVAKQQAYLYLSEIMNVLSFLFSSVRAITPTFTATGFDMRIELILTDVAKTEYDAVLSWNQVTQRATVV